MRNDCKGSRRLCLRLSTGRGASRRPPPLTRAAGRALSGCVLAAAVLAMPQAWAQFGASAALVSDYSARGLTLSQGRPEPQLRIDYDANGGWYAGGLASGVSLADSDARLQLLAYGGYAHRLPSGLSWEAGALDVDFVHGAAYRYHEFYAGLAGEGVSGRIYFSPGYYGEGKTLYAELNRTIPLPGDLTLSAHLGLLHPFGAGDDEARQRIDVRLALSKDVGDLNLQIAVLAATNAGRDAARRIAVGATYGF